MAPRSDRRSARGRRSRAWSRLAATAALLIGLGGIVALESSPQLTTQKLEYDVGGAGPVTPWPRPVPVRLAPEGRDELFVTTLGVVRTPLADGTFDPLSDRVTTDDGQVIENYYRDRLEIPFYAPIDKTHFPLPPSGWCSWYYYYQEINAPEVLANARWLARHLKPYGARYVQIDDGWQGTGHGLGENRDWTTIDVRFREPGMAAIADSIRALGLEAGLWLAPHGQSNGRVARESGAFLWTPDGSSASQTWEGTYLVDPSAPAAHAYLSDLFSGLRDWGYSYFKIDGQPIVLREFAKLLELMVGSVPEHESDPAAQLYRGTLQTIRDAIGADAYLLGCWGIPLPGIGILNGSRTGGDIVQGWDGFLVAAEAVQRWNFLHNVAWYSDPDVLLVRPPLSEGMARAWATIQGLSGQALMVSDRLPDLPESRVELLRRVFPAVDIRPLDLFKPKNVRKPIWDLKIEHLGRSYDVVAVFNYGTERPESRLVSWSALGLDPKQAYHVYDFWGGAYLGAWEDGVILNVPPADVRVVTLVPAVERPVLLSTSRHITQGWVELRALQPAGSSDRPTLAGRSQLVAGDPYTLTVGLPRHTPTHRLTEVATQAEKSAAQLSTTWRSHQGYASVTLRSDVGQAVDWELRFEPGEPYVFPVIAPSRLEVEQFGLSGARLRWPTQYHVKAGYQVQVDGRPVGVAFEPQALLSDFRPGQSYRLAVRSIWYDGSVGEGSAEALFIAEVPEEVHLSDLEPEVARQDWGQMRADRSVDGNPLSVGGRTYERGIGTHADSEIHYRIFGAFARFQAAVGVDDEVNPPTPVEVRFEVWGDGRRLWSSGGLRNGMAAVPLDLDVRGVELLVLRVHPEDDGIDYDHADWLDARLIAGRRSR